MGNSEERVNKALTGILRYLKTRPDSIDTAEGIRCWWLEDGSNELGDIEVQAAIEQLIRSGLMVSRTLPDGTVLYAANAVLSRQDNAGKT
ncbi:MAG TPA: hypothetical protein VM532_01775 [Burkholderiales bacterium]|nr:hypothetical protein [Burkholderiales bacterium]